MTTPNRDSELVIASLGLGAYDEFVEDLECYVRVDVHEDQVVVMTCGTDEESDEIFEIARYVRAVRKHDQD